MPDLDRRRQEEHRADRDSGREQVAARDATKDRDERLDLRLDQRNERAEAGRKNEATALERRHLDLGRELRDFQTEGRSKTGDSVSRAETERSLLDRFQECQRNQLTALQDVERAVQDRQAHDAAEFERLGQDRLDAIDRLGSRDRSDDRGEKSAAEKSRDRLEQKLQDERTDLEASFRSEQASLEKHRESTLAQMERDERSFLEALYKRDTSQDWSAELKDVINRQLQENERLAQESRRFQPEPEAERSTRPDAARQATRNEILDQRFSKHAAIRELWEDAVRSGRNEKDPGKMTSQDARQEYSLAMKRFINRLVDEHDSRAKEARAIFERSGFHFEREEGALKKQLPMLKLDKVASEIDQERHRDLLRVSGQHMEMIRDNPRRALDADNLRFMISRDNIQMDSRSAESRAVRDRLVEELEREP